MDLQKLYSYTRKAIAEYDMIQKNDKIAIGVSGGKDSLTLVYALAGLKKFFPEPFDIMAISIDLGFGNQDFGKISDMCHNLQVPLEIVPTQIAEIVFEARQESNPCSLCAKMRKGTLNAVAKEFGCTSIAYAHHKDDMIETMLLSLFFEGRFHSFLPVTHFDDTELRVIRPMMYIPEREVVNFSRRMDLPVAKNPCPADGHTKREYVKQLLAHLNKEIPGCKERLFHALIHSDLEGFRDRIVNPRINNKEN